MTSAANPLDLAGLEFVELAGPDPAQLHRLLRGFGFSRTMQHGSRAIHLYEQNDIRFFVNEEKGTHAHNFQRLHGPSIAAMGWRVRDAEAAAQAACARGATVCWPVDLARRGGERVPAVVGLGGMLIYLIDQWEGSGVVERYARLDFAPLPRPDHVAPMGFTAIDHLTNNVAKGTMQEWASFYKDVFGFTEVRYFDIRGVRTGLTSYALRSPCGTFCIPINEADEAKSQINEYLEEYGGPGVQHLAFATDDILASLRAMEGSPFSFLDIDADYYDEAFARVPNVVEDHDELRRRNVLVDGDEHGYLLQIFTKNLLGPIFIELIQRKNHSSFGEGNFTALFRSIERDQARRGVFAEPGSPTVVGR